MIPKDLPALAVSFSKRGMQLWVSSPLLPGGLGEMLAGKEAFLSFYKMRKRRISQ